MLYPLGTVATLSPAMMAQMRTVAAPSAAALRSVASAPTAAASAATSFSIIPEAYRRLEEPVKIAESSVAPGSIFVTAWPFVRLSDSQVKATLDAITGPSGVGPAVVPGLAAASGVGSGDPVARARSLAPSFLATGFIRDEGVDQSVTRGYIWIAMSWGTPQSRLGAGRAAKAILGEALKLAGASFASGKPSAGQVWSSAQTPGTVAADESDSSIEDAAKKGVLALAQGLSAIAGGLGFSGTVSFPASRARSQVRSLANTMFNAARAASEGPVLVQQAEQLAAQALSLPDQAAAGQAILQAKQRLLEFKRYILEGSAQATAAAQLCETESSPESSQIAKSIRDQVVSDAGSALAKYRSVPSVARRFQEAWLWKRAQTQLTALLRGLAEEIAQLCATARALLNNVTAMQQLVAQIDATVTKLDYTYQQLRIDWWQRDWAGVPAYYWMGGGGLIVAGLVVWRVRSRSKARAAARAAAPTAVAKNKARWPSLRKRWFSVNDERPISGADLVRYNLHDPDVLDGASRLRVGQMWGGGAGGHVTRVAPPRKGKR